MKKSNLIVTIILIILVIILTLYFVNREKEKVDYSSNINFNGKQLIAIAWLNNIEEASSRYIKKFDSIKVYQLSGEQNYLILSRYKSIEINIFDVILEEDNFVKGDLIATVQQPFIISCDISNIMFEIKYKDKIFEYFPSLNSEDNSINTNDYVLDITK